MNTPKILPCARHPGELVEVWSLNKEFRPDYWQVSCPHPSCLVDGTTKLDAVAKWNLAQKQIAKNKPLPCRLHPNDPVGVRRVEDDDDEMWIAGCRHINCVIVGVSRRHAIDRWNEAQEENGTK